MNALIPLFIDIKVTDIIDILLVAYLLYAIYKLVKGSVAINILAGIFLVYILWKSVELLHMRMLSEILNQFISVGVLALIIVFQPEIRKFLIVLGERASNSVNKNAKISFFQNIMQQPKGETNIEAILEACSNMSKSKTGALIILRRKNNLDEIIHTGEILNANVSSALLENIFFKNSPLHDGAVIISDNKIVAARCVLNITNNPNFPPDYGLRHRAGLGTTESTDAFAIIVSEQTGKIALAENGHIQMDVSLIELKRNLITEFTAKA